MTDPAAATAAAAPAARANRLQERVSEFAAWLGVSRWTLAAFGVCTVLALVAVWGHRYPAGIDLPQHAHLFRLWTGLHGAPVEFRDMYRVQLYTPYLLPYATAYPFTLAFGALAATKCLFSISAVLTPILLARWFKAVGAEPAFGLVGFVVAFDYSYLWGFISYTTAIPLLLAYFTALELQGDRPSVGSILRMSLFGIGIFFSHGIIFGFAVIVVGLRLVLDGRWLARYRRGLHLIPMAAVALTWILVRQKEAVSAPASEWFNAGRAVALFSSTFWPMPDQNWALIAMGGVMLFVLFARPRLSFSVARVVPVGVALLLFVALPDWIASTWLVGTRFAVFVHAFAPACLAPGAGDAISKRWRGALFALVTAFLLLLNARLADFNHELAGLRKLAAKIPLGRDLKTLVVNTELDSKAIGSQQFGQVPGWITAERGGMLENDSAGQYYQMPLRRVDGYPFPQEYQYAIAHGEPGRYNYALRALSGASAPSAVAGKWLLYERPLLRTSEYEVVRWGQGYGKLQKDAAVGGGRLSIAGKVYEHGLGTHARSFIRLHFSRKAKRFEGACGLDEGSSGRGRAQFRIRNDDDEILFDSGPMKSGEPAKRFAVSLGDRRELLLEVLPVKDISFAHADWVDLGLH